MPSQYHHRRRQGEDPRKHKARDPAGQLHAFLSSQPQPQTDQPTVPQTYGYNFLPLLLALAAPPLGVLLPQPLPASAPAGLAAKYPYTALRKPLRLLIEDADPLEELENDISYVYSGYAPISVRLVQCVAQKGGVLSNPAGDRDKRIAGRRAAGADAAGIAAVKVQAHPIVGWKGFEDVVGSIPGEAVDTVQRVPGAGAHDGGAQAMSTLGERSLLSAFAFDSSLLTGRRGTAVLQRFRRNRVARLWCSSWGDAHTRRSPPCGGWGDRTKVRTRRSSGCFEG